MFTRAVQCCAILVCGAATAGLVSACATDLVVEETPPGSGGAHSSNGTNGGLAWCWPELQINAEARAWVDNPAECPAAAPSELRCDVPEGTVCVYVEDATAEFPGASAMFGSGGTSPWMDQYHNCACLENLSAQEPQWYCRREERRPELCPEAVPEDSEACMGYRGMDCRYPDGTNCSCTDQNAPVWQCDGPAGSLEPPDIDPTTLVSQLSSEERATLCEWLSAVYRGGTGYRDVEDLAVDANGFTTMGNGTIGCSFLYDSGNESIWLMLSSSQCEGNLRVSQCQAPLSELTRCATAETGEASYGVGCSRYFQHPGCNGTAATNSCVSDATPFQMLCTSLKVE